MIYDGHGRQQRWIFPSRTTPGVADAGDYEQYLYDPNGNRTSLRKRDGSVLGYWYDALNRMTAKIVPERAGLTAAQTRDVYYDYDLSGLQTKARFDSLAGEGVTTAYDGFGRPVSSTLAMAGTSRTIGHQYDGEGNRTRITHPDGAFFPYDYDGLGRFLRVGENGPDPLVAFTYDSAGHRSGLASGGMASAFAHDPAGRPVSLAHDLAGTGGDQTIGLGYNPASQIVSRTESNDAYAWTGAVAVNRPYAVNGLNQYSSAGASTFAYDPNGNLITATQPPYTSNYVYDVENRLVSASGAQTAFLVYDPLGRLFQTSGWASGATQFLYDDDALVAEYNSAGTMVHRYIHGALKGVDDPLIWYDNLASGWRRPLIADQQGSIIAVADMYGNPVAINAYDEYGIPKFGNVGRFQYTGQAWIPELGMYHYKSRLYSPTLGRFLQTDTIGYEGGINLYGYVDNDPVNSTDPTGEVCVPANGWSDYCRRGALYYRLDQKFAGRTRFFGAASRTTTMLANLSMPGFNRVVSGQTRGFMSGLSANLERMNTRIAKGIESGRIGGARLDARIVHAEQTVVQAHLNALTPNARQSIVSEVNGLLNPSGATGAAASFYSSDRAYQNVLDGVRKNLGGPIDFGNQSHREAIGNALVRDLRSSGACNQTGTRIQSC